MKLEETNKNLSLLLQVGGSVKKNQKVILLQANLKKENHRLSLKV